MLQVKGLTKQFGKKVTAVDNISFGISKGETCILLGPNGAGKSTTMKCIAGLLKFKGDISINDYPNNTLEAKQIYSYVPETPSLYDLLTIDEHIEFIAKAYNINNYESYKNELKELKKLILLLVEKVIKLLYKNVDLNKEKNLYFSLM